MGWSDLPCELVISIAAHLWEAGDYLRFRAVCRSWKSAVIGFRPSFFPWLATIHCNYDDDRYELPFFSHVANNYVYKSPIPGTSIEFYPRHISNNDGWIMYFKHADGVATIFNPVTGVQLQPLPSLCTCFDRYSRTFLSDNFFAIAAVHHTDVGNLLLAAATPGDDTWSVINPSLPYYFDDITSIVFHEADHKFYAVDYDGKLLAFCLTRCGAGKTVVGKVCALSRRQRGEWYLFEARLLSRGSNLLLVGKPSQRKKDFKILKYCPDADTWIGLTDIGNYSIFIDSHAAKLLPVPQGAMGSREGFKILLLLAIGFICVMPGV